MTMSSPVPTHSSSTRALLGLSLITGLWCLLWMIGAVCSSPDPNPQTLKFYVNPNEASVAELLSLPGLGPTRAQAIVDYREQQQAQGQDQPFLNLEDLTKIRGLGPSTVQRLSPYLDFQSMQASP